jgi:hypothetical protein
MRSALTGRAGRRLLGAVALLFLVTACAEVTALIGPVPGLGGLPGVTGPAPAAPADFAIPAGAVRYRVYLMQAWQYHFAMAEDPAIGFGQVHQESRFDCSAVSSGGSVGCAQFRPATAAEVNQWIPAQVRATCPVVSGCPLDPKWALTAMVEYDFHLWNGVSKVATPRERWGFTLSAYNGGGAVTGAERAACARSRDCDPARYFHNVERYCGSFGRSEASCRENREYPHVILDTWAPGYHRWLQG